MDTMQIFSVVLVLISLITMSVLVIYYSNVISNDISVALGAIGTVFSDARTFVGGVLDDVGNQLVNAGNLIAQAVTTIVNTIEQALVAFFNDALSLVNGLGSLIASTVTDFANALVQLGTDIGNLLSNGWDSVESFFTGSLYNAIAGIINAIKP